MKVRFRRLDERAVMPRYAHPGDAGADLSCLEGFELNPGERKLIRTGIAIELPAGFVGLVHPRSGLATKHGITIVNTPGTIDSEYRGEIMINLINLDPIEVFSAEAGSRIAQLIVQEFCAVNFVESEQLNQSARGESGFGSTGVKS
jgi:dUTP pyrophosphatase